MQLLTQLHFKKYSFVDFHSLSHVVLSSPETGDAPREGRKGSRLRRPIEHLLKPREPGTRSEHEWIADLIGEAEKNREYLRRGAGRGWGEGREGYRPHGGRGPANRALRVGVKRAA